MTVIATIISKYCCAHASDSLLTRKKDGVHEKLEYEKTKIVAVRHFSGAMAYWGLAEYKDFSTLKWLSEQAIKSTQFMTPEDFAIDISKKLNYILSKLTFKNEIEKGIGIHFTAYEKVDGIQIPELFSITNFKGTKYNELLPEGVRVARETYGNLPETLREDSISTRQRDPQYRHIVYNFLENGGLFLYNNGDTEMFNPAASGIFNMFNVAASRGIFKLSGDAKAYRRIVKWPIDLVSKMQKEYVKDGYQVVGGKPHNISITPSGVYGSDTDKF